MNASKRLLGGLLQGMIGAWAHGRRQDDWAARACSLLLGLLAALCIIMAVESAGAESERSRELAVRAQERAENRAAWDQSQIVWHEFLCGDDPTGWAFCDLE